MTSTTTMKISQFESEGDSISLLKIDGQPFHIVKIEGSAYNEDPGFKITTEESFTIDGVKWNKFHTTRRAVVAKLNDEKVRKQLEIGKIGPMICKLTKAKTAGVKDYWVLQDT